MRTVSDEQRDGAVSECRVVFVPFFRVNFVLYSWETQLSATVASAFRSLVTQVRVSEVCS